MRVIFDHTPKSGGTSVIQSLDPNLHRRIAFGCPREKADTILKSKVPVISSHWACEPGEWPARRTDFYLSWIRHPVAMLQSGWNFYHCPDRPHTNFRPVKVRDSIANMLREDTLDAYVDAILLHDLHPHFPCYYFDKLDRHRESYDFIGVTEAMDLSMKQLGSAIGRPLQATHVNKSAQRRGRYDRMSDDRWKALERLWEPEMVLWQHLLSERLAS